MEKATQDFKAMMIAVHPEHAKKILEIFDDKVTESEHLEADLYTGEYIPLSADEVSDNLKRLQAFGFDIETE